MSALTIGQVGDLVRDAVVEGRWLALDELVAEAKRLHRRIAPPTSTEIERARAERELADAVREVIG